MLVQWVMVDICPGYSEAGQILHGLLHYLGAATYKDFTIVNTAVS